MSAQLDGCSIAKVAEEAVIQEARNRVRNHIVKIVMPVIDEIVDEVCKELTAETVVTRDLKTFSNIIEAVVSSGRKNHAKTN